MATRTPHTGVALEVFTAANLTKYPKGWLGYFAKTSDATGYTTEATITGLGGTITTGADRMLRFHLVTAVQSSQASDRWKLRLKVNGTTYQEFRNPSTAANLSDTGNLFAIADDLAAGSYTIIVTLERTAGSGTLTHACSTTNPAILIVEDIGPAS